MKTKLFTLLLAVAASIGTMFAWDYERVQIGDLYYNLDATSQTAEVTSQNSSYPYWSTTITTAIIPASVEYNSVTYSVTSIGWDAFYGCSGLTSVTIPNSVTSIGEGAFYDCSGLTSINVASDNSNYCSVDGILFNKDKTTLIQYPGAKQGAYTIPNSVTSIGNYAFSGCSGLTSVTIPNSVTSIGEGAFYDCSGLTSVTIGNSVTSIGDWAFEDCSSLTSVIWNAKNCADFAPNNTPFYSDGYYYDRYWDELKFDLRPQITSFTFGNEVEHIPANLCNGMSNLTSVTIPNSVTSIGEGAFYDCSGLTSVTIPNSVTSIGSSAFMNVPNVVYSGSATGSPWEAKSVNGYVDGYLVYSDDTRTTLITCSSSAQGEIVIPNSVTSIVDGAFRNCTGLTSVTIPNSVTSIGSNAFYDCTGLTSVTIGNSVTSIGVAAFEGCTGLTSITIGNSVTSIGSGAFYECSSLTSVTIPNSVTSIGSSAFSGCSGLTSVTINSSAITGKSYSYDSNLQNIFGSQVTEYIIGNDVTSIGDWAFAGCTGLTSINVVSDNSNYCSVDGVLFNKDKTTLIQYPGAKQGAYSIPNSVTSFGDVAFVGCSGLTSIEIPNSVTSIGGSAFRNCTGLTSVTIPNSVTSIGGSAFRNCTGLTSVTIGNSVTSIGDWAFENCTGLTSVTIGISVTSIGKEAFAGCTGLTSVIWNAKNYADFASNNTPFYANYNNYGTPIQFDLRPQITSFTFGNEVEHIPANLCKGMSYLTSVTIEVETPPTLGKNVFIYTNISQIYVPCGTLEAYKSAWSDYASIIKYLSLDYNIYGNVNVVEWGYLIIPQYACKDNVITAVSNYGYHFMQWSDGITDNPRTIVLTQDTTFTAEFAKNTYTISTTSANPEWGTTAGDKSALYLDVVKITASSNYGYHFVKWNDDNVSNPRKVSVTEDKTYTATFAKNIYSITKNAAHGSISGNSSAEYLDEVTLTANPDYGYHFNQWSDGVTDNPRTFVLTQDTTFTAEFAHNPVITYIYDSSEGSVSGDTTTQAGVVVDAITFEAIPNYGYHFVQWSDGVTDNPRTFVLIQDTTFTAEFSKNTYTITTESSNSAWGTTAGDKSALFLENVEISAAANYGYHFAKWDDENTENPRMVSVTEDKTYTATFAKNVYTITLNNAEHGTISGNTSAEYLDEVTLTANPEYGYHFAQWSDGNTENPHTIVLTQDTTFNAEFAIDRTGNCGDDNALTWTYDPETKTLTITGNGALNSNYTFGVEAPTQMQKLVIGNEVTAIGDSAFYGMSTINHLIIGGSVATIGNYAFAECRNFDDITCLANVVPVINETTFANVGNKQYIYLFVPEARERAYHRDTYWGEFDIQVQQAEETTVTTNDVTVEPQDNAVTLAWPTNDNAASYTIEITKDGVLFCTLTFNANGQLTGIAFAPSRDGHAHAPAAVMTANGLQFTVTGLDSNTQYGYNLIAKDANNQTIATYSGVFTTTGEIATGIDNIQGNEVQSKKFVRNGQIFILRGDKTYTIQGQEVK